MVTSGTCFLSDESMFEMCKVVCEGIADCWESVCWADGSTAKLSLRGDVHEPWERSCGYHGSGHVCHSINVCECSGRAASQPVQWALNGEHHVWPGAALSSEAWRANEQACSKPPFLPWRLSKLL